MNTELAFMVVKIRFARGPFVTRRKGKNSRIALLGGSILTLGSICLSSLGIWRLCQDLDIAEDFIFQDGFLSHWQVWIGSAVAMQYGCWRLTKYAKQATADQIEIEPAEVEQAASEQGIAANV